MGEKLLESPLSCTHVKSPLSLTETEQMLPGVSESPRQTVSAVCELGRLQQAWWGG